MTMYPQYFFFYGIIRRTARENRKDEISGILEVNDREAYQNIMDHLRQMVFDKKNVPVADRKDWELVIRTLTQIN